MAFVTGALGNLVPKLLEILQDEYKLQKGVKEQIKCLARELESMHAALCKVAEVPHDELDPQVKLWASEVREASYDMEDVIDAYLVRVDGGNQTTEDDKTRVKSLREKMGKLFSLSKFLARREIASTIKDITKKVEEITKRRDRYRLDDRVANSSATGKSVDPRLLFLHTKVSELVGIDEPRDALIKEILRVDNDGSDSNTKVVSIFGCGGLGKTTLARVVYDKLATDMNIHCKAFVPVGQKPDLRKVLRDILLELNNGYYMSKTNFMMLDERQLINEIQDFLKEKRYMIVIDDIWEVSSWKIIKTALKDNKLGSKIIITTRCGDVANDSQVHYSYNLMPLLPESSEILFYGRIFGSKEKCPKKFSGLSEKFLKKCGGMPLAIITLSSLLADKLEDITVWEGLYNAIGSGISNTDDGMRNMGKILSLSYYDLPSHLKNCFLYLSIFPEDYYIETDQLIWMWIAEGFIQPQQYFDDLFELGETYFNELINRSLVQPVASNDYSKNIYACRVHDMILDLIHSLSREENFVITSDQVMSSETKQIHRLSLNNNITTCPKVGLSRVRSLVMFQLSVHSMPSISSFGYLRVLVLFSCPLGKSEGLNVGNLIHLRFLWLYFTGIKELPEGIEKLQYLQVLKFSELDVPLLQPIFLLKRLVCLEGISCYPRPGNLLGNLASLQVLCFLHVNEDTASAVDELGHLTKLTKLHMVIEIEISQCLSDVLVSSLDKLQRLHALIISQDPRRELVNNLIDLEKWTPPLHLRKLVVHTLLQTLPKWISPTSLPHLSHLSLNNINVVRPNDIQILGELPSLSFLQLWAGKDNVEGPLQKIRFSDDAFPRATSCDFWNVVIVPSMFPQGAMSRVKKLHVCVRAWDFFSNEGLDFNDLAMEQFPSLQKVCFRVIGSNSEEVEKVKEALKHAADTHPNHPSISNQFWER